jgi:hypothetical protein
MKTIFTCILVSCVAICSNAQIKLSDKDFTNLVALSDLYSDNNMCTGDGFAKTANSLRTPLLNNMVNMLIASGKQDTSLLAKRFLQRPDNDELMLWYVLREIHYNHVDTSKKPLPSAEVAKKVLAEKIDERWLVDNYYYRAHSGLAMLFNTADLSNYSFNMDSLGLKNQTEKSIFFFNMMGALANGRFQVLKYLNKTDKLIQMSDKLPKFNGKVYFYYTDLDFPDFDWIGYNKTELYKEKNINDLINTLLIQFMAMANAGNKAGARELYFNSILHKPEYFKYSPQKDDLQSLYDQSK